MFWLEYQLLKWILYSGKSITIELNLDELIQLEKIFDQNINELNKITNVWLYYFDLLTSYCYIIFCQCFHWFIIVVISFILINSSKPLFWLWHFIFITPFYINSIVLMVVSCLYWICGITYYKIRFDQLDNEIKWIFPNGK